MKLTVPPLESITALPLLIQVTGPRIYRDTDDQMEIDRFAAIFDSASDELAHALGMSSVSGGIVYLEQHITYLNNVRTGGEIAIYARVVARTAKHIHYLLFMVDVLRSQLAAVFECVGSYLDRSVRKTAPWPPQIAEKIDELVVESNTLDWPAPLCGVIAP